MNKQRPGNHQMKVRGVGSRECTLWRGRGAHFGGEGDRGPTFGGGRERRRNGIGLA